MGGHDGLETQSSNSDFHITVLFSASVSDISLQVSDPAVTTAAGLKQLIRKNLPDNLTKRRLRLIHAGKVLEDGVSLSTSLRIAPRKADVKGKRPIRGSEDPEELPAQSHNQRTIHIHCSIGETVLSDKELKSEADLSSILSSIPVSEQPGSAGQSQDQSEQGAANASTTLPAPLGFDRLLSAGLTASEVSALRAEFITVLLYTHTRDNIPTGEDLRRLEDQWLDDGSIDPQSNAGTSGSDFTAEGAFGNVSRDRSGAWDDALWGSMMGFFWPVGCGMWLLKEDGVWSFRKGTAVFLGIMVNLVFGTMRWLS